MIELLDPNIDTRDPVIRDGDIDSLIKVVLFEDASATSRDATSLARRCRPSPPRADQSAAPRHRADSARCPPPEPVPPPVRSARRHDRVEVDDDAIAKLR